MPKDLLLEIGTEELPASFVAGALEAMPRLAAEALAAARLAHGAIRPLGTPRRLALIVEGVADRQSDLSEVVQGPPKSVAMGADGKPTQAGAGFAKKQGVSPETLFVVSTDKGEYVAVRKEAKGEAAGEVLPAVLESIGKRIPFRKSMRWGEGEFAFGRPIHWIVALFGDAIVPLEFAGVRSGRATRGHRFLAPDAFELRSASEYVDKLRSAHVVVDPDERRKRVAEQLRDAAHRIGGELVPDEFLLGETTSLVEEPHVVPGRFDESFLETVPEEVIVSVMRGHQRYFAVRDPKSRKLLPRYLNVVNTAKDAETIARGNDRVLRARLADARFFVEEDRKTPLAARGDRLHGVVFQAKLGTIGEKVQRIVLLASSSAEAAEPAAAAQAREAAKLAKNDLVTLIVGEFPELQGEMGRWYALAEGIEPVVADAIRDHYLPRGAGDAVPKDVVSASVALADRIDTLVGCFGIGLVPSGSADPFALRRAALGVVRIALEGPIDVDLRAKLDEAHALYAQKGLAGKDDVLAKLDEFFRARLRAFYGEKHPVDLVEACLAAWDGRSIRDLDARVRAVAAFREMPEYESLAVAFKRTFNIAKEAPAGEPDAKLFTEDAEKALGERWHAVRPAIEAAVGEGDYERALRTVARDLRQPVDLFFEKVFVMVEDAAVRDNRLRLLGGIARTLTRIAHFNLLGG